MKGNGTTATRQDREARLNTGGCLPRSSGVDRSMKTGTSREKLTTPATRTERHAEHAGPLDGACAPVGLLVTRAARGIGPSSP